MNSEDFAIVVGIDDYCKNPYQRLKGARRDAIEFINWLKSPDGGNLPPQNVDPYTKLSTDDGSSPVFSEILPLLETIRGLAPPDQRRIGRRLYIFLSGHSVSPDELDDAGLVTLESEERFTVAFPGKQYADKLCLAGHFGEVLLFMDCCQLRDRHPAMELPIRLHVDTTANTSAKRFYAFATAFSAAGREAEWNGNVRGIFSRHLIEGLRTAADGRGRLTTIALRSFLEARMRDLVVNGETQTPHFAVSDELVLLAGRPPHSVNVNLDFRAPSPASLLILDGGNHLAPVQPAHLHLTPLGATFSLPSGKRYVVQGLDAAGTVLRTVIVTAAEDDLDERL